MSDKITHAAFFGGFKAMHDFSNSTRFFICSRTDVILSLRMDFCSLLFPATYFYKGGNKPSILP